MSHSLSTLIRQKLLQQKSGNDYETDTNEGSSTSRTDNLAKPTREPKVEDIPFMKLAIVDEEMRKIADVNAKAYGINLDASNSFQAPDAANFKKAGRLQRFKYKITRMDSNFKFNQRRRGSAKEEYMQVNDGSHGFSKGPDLVPTMRTSRDSVTLSPAKLSLESFPDGNKQRKSQSSADRGSIIPMVSSISTTSSASSAKFIPSARTIPLTSSNSSSSLRFFSSKHHSRTGSSDEKRFKKLGLVKTRGRSRTVDLSDYPSNAIPHHTENSKHSDSRASSIDLSGNISTSAKTFYKTKRNSSFTGSQTNVGVRPKYSKSPYGSLNSTAPPISAFNNRKRSGSIANAISSIVARRSHSSSSGTLQAQASLSNMTLNDFPPVLDPEEGQSPRDYLKAISMYGKFIGVILSEKDDEFKAQCLHCFFREFFDFLGDPLDIALRKLLIFIELPKEAQQIDRVLKEFGNVYYDQQNILGKPTTWIGPEQVYFLAYSLLMLHTDYFNAKNKYKMTKREFVDLIKSDTYSDGDKVPTEILMYYYDNVTARESPKFVIPVGAAIEIDEMKTHNQETGGFYSPIDLIRTKSLIAQEKNNRTTPRSTTTRPPSNSITSYFSHGTGSLTGSAMSLVQDDIDIYNVIFNDNLHELTMEDTVSRFWDFDSEFVPWNIDYTGKGYEKFFGIIKDVRGGYLKIHKSHSVKLNLPNFEVMYEEPNNDYYLLKIIQISEMDILYYEKKFTVLNSTSQKPVWKTHLCVLTLCGLLIFDKADWMDPQVVGDPVSGTSNYIIEMKSSLFHNVGSVSCFTGLFAVKDKDSLGKSQFSWFHLFSNSTTTYNRSSSQHSHHMELDDYEGSDMLELTEDDQEMERLIFIHTSMKNFVWRSASRKERDNWVDAINLVAAYDECFYEPGVLPNTLISRRKKLVKERVMKLSSSLIEKSMKLEAMRANLNMLARTMPIKLRTRNDLIKSIKQLAVKMDWLVYEIERNDSFIFIIRQVDIKFDNCLDNDEMHEHRTSGDSLGNATDIEQTFIHD